MSTKICADCTHYRKQWWKAKPYCQRGADIDVVSGKARLRTCEEARDNEHFCSYNANWFKKK